MRTILFATDLSLQAAPAQAVAITLAHALRARLEMLHVVHIPPAATLDGLGAGLVDTIRRWAEVELAQRRATIAAEGLDVGTCVHVGVVDVSILDRAKEVGADLIVVGTHGRTGAARLFVGSVAERTVHHAGCPVLVVPPTTSESFARWVPGRALRVVLGLDESRASHAALAWLRQFKQSVACDMQLLHFYWPPREHERLGLGPYDPNQRDPELEVVLTRELRKHVAAHLGDEDIRLRLCPTWGGEERSLAREAETDDADLLVVGTNQVKGGSTAIGALRGAGLPVLCVPAKTLAVPRYLRDDEAPVREVLVTTDLSPLGNAAIPEAYRLVGGGGAVILAFVAPPAPPLGLAPEVRTEIETTLLSLIPRGVDTSRVHTRAFIVESASAGDAILQAVRRFDPDVVVMSSHGRSGLGRLVRGSVTERVLRESPKPVLVVPGSAVAPADLQPQTAESQV